MGRRPDGRGTSRKMRRAYESEATRPSQPTMASPPLGGTCTLYPTAQGTAYVIDHAIDEETLQWIDTLRISLPLDSKRPTVDRRFFADGSSEVNSMQHSSNTPLQDPNRPLARLLEESIQAAVIPGSSKGEKDGAAATCHIFRYQRFLEYTKAGSKLDPHTDGTKVCDDTKLVSTHTLLLYLTNCEEGGETVLLTECCKELPANLKNGCNDKESELVIHATQPKRGRILLFPHATPHAGAAVVQVPKICLRAEVCLSL